MASLGPRNCALVEVLVGGSKASGIKLVLQREPRTGNTRYPTGSILPSEEHVDAAVRELFEGTYLTLTVDDLAMLSNKPIRVSLLEWNYHLVYVFSAYVPVPNVTANLRTPSFATCNCPVDHQS
jgi:8-oxo-dGTP pyrophosphatase MutT (NUDIX family)